MKIIVKGGSTDMQKIFYPAGIEFGVICGGDQKSVVRSAELSYKIMDGFQKNQLRPLIIIERSYKCPRIIEFGAFWMTIWRFVNFPTFSVRGDK